jgi:hypothetical protein
VRPQLACMCQLMCTAVSQLRSDQLVPLHRHAHFMYPACLYFLYRNSPSTKGGTRPLGANKRLMGLDNQKSTGNRQSERGTNETGKCCNLKSLTQNQALEQKHLWANSTKSQTRDHQSQVQDHPPALTSSCICDGTSNQL